MVRYPASHLTGRLSKPRNAQPRSGPALKCRAAGPQPGEDAGQRHVGHHGARGEGAGAIMRAGAEGDAFRCIAGDVETVRIAKASLVAIGRAEHEDTRSSGSKSTPSNDQCLATRRGDIPIGAIQRAYSSNTSSHFALPSRTSAS